MYPDHVALITVTRLAKGIGNSAMPNAPVVDDRDEPLSWLERVAAARMRLAGLIWPGELIVAPGMPDPAPAGC